LPAGNSGKGVAGTGSGQDLQKQKQQQQQQQQQHSGGTLKAKLMSLGFSDSSDDDGKGDEVNVQDMWGLSSEPGRFHRSSLKRHGRHNSGGGDGATGRFVKHAKRCVLRLLNESTGGFDMVCPCVVVCSSLNGV
jgi:hypothetical protein